MDYTETFARIHAGRKIIIRGYDQLRQSSVKYNELIGRIVGFDLYSNDNRVVIEPDNGRKGSMYVDDRTYVVVELHTITHSCLRFPPDYLQFILDLPDDCDDCGAKGDQPCNNNCPNKENT